jgi:hypothetical protein
MNSDATISPTNGTSTAYINGKLSKILGSAGDDFIFPVGKAGKWGYAGVYNVSTGGLIWDVEYFSSSALAETLVDNFTPTSGTIVDISESEYWKITDNGSSNAEIKISWNSSTNVSSDQTEREKLEVMAWNDGASTWNNYGGDTFSAGHTQTGGSFLSTASIAFSTNIITLGSSDAANPLPVEMLYFTGKANAEQIDLFWATATEKNNDYFEIQHSLDAENFTTIGRVYGKGSTLQQSNYNFTHKNPNYRTNYYRLNQVDYDGAFEIHKIIAVDVVKSKMSLIDINIYPNPMSLGDDLTLNLQQFETLEPITITIMNLKGKLIYRGNEVIPENKTINLIPELVF